MGVNVSLCKLTFYVNLMLSKSTIFLVTGSTGLLGRYLVNEAGKYGKVFGVARSKSNFDCDLTKIEEVRSMIATIKPDVILHAAAMVDIDVCENDQKNAWANNVLAVNNLLKVISPDSCMVFLSSVAVYPDIKGPHKENIEGPVNYYGQTKLEAEKMIKTHINHLIFRGAMFGPSKSKSRMSLSDFIIERLSKNKPVTLFDDELFSPLHLSSFSKIILISVNKGLQGTFNIGSQGGMSKAEFGFKIADHLGLSTDMVSKRASTEISGRSKRAIDMRLDSSSLEKNLNYSMPTLIEEIKKL